MNKRKRRLLGQHFLIDNNVLNMMLNNAEIGKEVVYEIGTGNGFVTVELCKRASKVISCESDKDLLSAVEFSLRKYDNLTLLHGNGFMFDGSFELFVSNLPYAKSRTAVEWLATRNFDRGVIMVQKEFAFKILSRKGKNYRAVSALAQYCFNIEIIMHVGKESFNPQPKVDSALLKIVQKHRVHRSVVKALNLLFSYRGKKVGSVAKNYKIRNVDVEKRIEQLTPTEAVGLARIIAEQEASPIDKPPKLAVVKI